LVGHIEFIRRGEEYTGFLVVKPEGKISRRRPRHRWGDNIKMDLQDVGYGVMDWFDLAQDVDMWQALLKAVMNLRVP